MKSFLEYIADDMLAKYGSNLSRLAVVFPNKRASLFLNEYLARKTEQPLWSPHYITISELFRNYSQRLVADPIKLVSDLHKTFTECTGIDESLDHFYGWGQLLLSDFDDVDKNMAPADRVFANLRDIHELDDISYLSQEQKDILRHFFSNFNEEHNTELKRRFLQLWSHIGDIYHAFNQRLADQGLAYEGALYREVAELQDIEFEYETYIFVGFNLLQKVEQDLFLRMKHEGKARFYWDFDDYYLGKNEAGHYIAQYLSDFPNELDNTDRAIYHNFAKQKDITFIAAPTENIQARYISTWLRKDERLQSGRQTAIVLCNEDLLQTAIHSLPEEVEKMNITTGYPLAQTPIAAMVNLLISQEANGYDTQRQCYRLHYINHVLRHPYAQYISEKFREVYDQLNTQKDYYPKVEHLAIDDGLALLFPALGNESADFNLRLLRWLLSLVRHIATTVDSTNPVDSPLTAESIFQMYTVLNRLADLTAAGDLCVDVITLQRLVTQIVNTTSIPFHGEPVEGIQMMGVLETRNLDFNHLLLLSCNEGYLPKSVSDTSFIPYSIRKAYGLTTIDHKVAIYAYYFHRLLQRADDITIVYNNSTEDGQTGEMSRFMLQMMVEKGQPIRQLTLQAGQKPTIHDPQPIMKTPQVCSVLQQRFAKEAGGISPTAINRYLRCQLQFFYHYVSGISESDDNEEDIIDNRVFGNIFHLAAQLIYQRLMQHSQRILATDIDELLKTQVDIERAVDEAFKQELFQIKDPARPLPAFDGLQLINREVIIKYLRQLLEIDRRLAPFTILGLERRVTMDITVNSKASAVNSTIGGFIDRLDSITTPDGHQRIRVIDYKTGSKRLKAIPDVDAIFAQESLKDHSDYSLQSFLYSHIVRLSSGDTPVSPALLFIQHAGTDDYDPTLCLGKEPVIDIASVSERFMELLNGVITEIFDPEVSFVPTDDRQRCTNCPYATLCGI